jgi:hypothetical protein
MKVQTVTEIASAIFISLASSGGAKFTQHAGRVINDAIAKGVISDPAAVKYLTRLAQIAEERSESTPPPT